MSQTDPPAVTPLRTAVRAAGRFDLGAIDPAAGLLAAIPVVGLLGGLTAAGQQVPAITTAVGAMLVGVGWRVGGGRPPLATLTVDALMMALATFVGAVTGNIEWLHLSILAVWSLGAGLLVAAGRQAGVVGFQSILAIVVFGRFSEPVGGALGLAGLVAAGGLTQVAFLTVVRWPSPIAGQRALTADALRALARLAAADELTSALPAAEALDDARSSLAAPSLLGARSVGPLRSLITVATRLRVTLSALSGLSARLPADAPATAEVHAIARQTSAALTAAADTVQRSGDAAMRLAELARAVTDANAALRAAPPPAGIDGPLWATLTRRLAGLGGQLRAIASLAPQAAARAGLRGRRPRGFGDQPLDGLSAGALELRANLSLQSPALRHAIRLALVVPACELLARALPLERGYWIVLAAAAVLRPEFGATFTRGTERAAGTALGVAIAGLVIVVFQPAATASIVLVGVCGFAGFSTFAASYALGFACITGLVVFLLNLLAPDTLTIATARLVDTLIGGSIGLALFAVWPTWARGPAQESLAALVESHRRYLTLVLDALRDGTEVPRARARELARGARLARTRAEADVMRSLGEPATHRIDGRVAPAALSDLLRVVHALHALRLDAEEDPDRAPMPRLAPLTRAFDVQLAALARGLASAELALSSEHIDLRALLTAFADGAGTPERALFGALDELVDAVDAVDELLAPV